MGLGQRIGRSFRKFVLPLQLLFNQLFEAFFGILMAVQTGIGDIVQRAAHMVAGVFNPALTHVGHMAVCAGQTAAVVDTGTEGFVVRMLRLEDGGAAELVGKVGKTVFVVVRFHLLG